MSDTSFSVDLLIVTPNQLRKITFNLAKDVKADQSVDWTMIFGLSERKDTTKDFKELVTLTVKIKKPHHAKAEATAIKGFDSSQASAALVAADTAKAFSRNKVSKLTANASAQGVIAARSTT
jgi:BRCT domain type II-containing protein